MLREHVTPISVSDAREGLSRALEIFRGEGATADPVIFGSHRKPEGVILSYEQYAALVETARLLEDLGDVSTLRDRLAAAGKVDPETLDDLSSVAAELGLSDALDD